MRPHSNKLCASCGHSLASHIHGVRCALCSCMIELRPATQESFDFREALLVRSNELFRRGN